jgi:hypothetical protein
LQWAGLIWDLAIIVLVAANLSLIVFDTLFGVAPVAAGVAAVSQGFHDWYAEAVHARFRVIDLYFVAVFVADVLLGWAVAVYERYYHRWFFYPFVHWYDVIGCIPLAGFRWLRALRVFALILRLQRMSFIDVRGWRVYAFFKKYYDILMEELSDRVAVNILEGIQIEVRRGGDLPQRIVREVFEPRKQKLAAAASERLERTVTRTYAANRDEIQAYVGNLIRRAVEDNVTIRNLERVPMLGGYVGRSLSRAIRDAVNNVLDETVAGLRSPEFDAMLEHVADSILAMLIDEESETDPELREAVVEIIELLKEQTRLQHWKETYV